MPDTASTAPDPGPSDAIRKSRAAVDRVNARASAGPESAAGKATVARNALRHGLAATRFAEPPPGPRWPRSPATSPGRGHAGAVDAALSIAQAQIDLQRVRLLRHQLLDRAESSAESMRERTLTSPEVADAAVVGFSGILREMVALSRARAVPQHVESERSGHSPRRGSDEG